MKAKVILAVVVFTMGAAGAAGAQDVCSEPVETVSGLVQGESEVDTATCVWRGIPYAAPPVGDLRWRPPQPHPEWTGLRDATQWGARCMQTGIMELVNADPSKAMSEDCLFLNVWRPSKSGRFPVMVWIHGGGYFGGTGNSKFYWGDRMAEAGEVVVVSFNYRLDIFGFFAHPGLREEDPKGAAGGQGSLDQVAALKWVHDNIENFGGDPGNVTIFGESAGGHSICVMMTTPLTKGMFHRAIMESGGCEGAGEVESGYGFAREAATKLGCEPDDLACLRAVPAKKVLDKAGGEMLETDFGPYVDGYLLPDTPINLIRSGKYHKVPFIAGYNRDEAANLIKLVPKYYHTRPARYEDKLVKMGFSSEDAARLAGLYPLAEFKNRPVNAYGRMFGVDTFFGCDTYDAMVETAARQHDVYFYRFEYEGFRFSNYAGVAHAMEMPYIFNSMDRAPVTPLYGKKHIERAEPLSRVMQGYWVNFARTGDPNGPGLPQWPEFTPGDQRVQVLDAVTRPEPVEPLPQRCEFWRDARENYEDLPSLFEILQ